MATFQDIDTAIEQMNGGQITKKRKSPLTALVLTVVGVAAACSHYFVPAIASNLNAASAMTITGWTLALAGAIMLVINLAGRSSFDYYYAPTGEKLYRSELSFEPHLKDKVRRFVEDGDFAGLLALPSSQIATVKVTCYAASKKDVIMAQAFEFVPHNHVPMTEVVEYPKGKCSL